MIRHAKAVAALVVSCLSVVACAGTQGYAGDPRPASEVATVIGEFEIIRGSARAAVVSIESIDGARRRGRWKRGTAIVELPPGSYEFVFGVDEGSSPFAPEPTEANGRARRARLDVAASRAYHVWFDHEGGYFFMRVTSTDGDDRVVPPASGSRARCQLGLTDRDVAVCERVFEEGE